MGTHKSLITYLLVASVKTSILPRVPKPCLTHGFPTERDHAHFSRHVWCLPWWAFFWSPSPHTMSAVLTWPLQSLIPLLRGISPAPYHTVCHQEHMVGGLAQHATALLSRIINSFSDTGDQDSYGKRLSLPFSFSADLSFLILYRAESLSLPKHAPPNWPWGLCAC